MASSQTSWLQRVRFYSSGALLYVVSIACVGFALHTPRVGASTVMLAEKVAANTSKIMAISGQPVRIVIPSEGVDLPLIPGTYDRADNSWTLSAYEAQFATSSTPANNVGGETFIYGHNNDYVLGALRHVTPAAGSEALIYTNNYHIFAYTFQKTWSVAPYDVTTIDYQGPPVLLIQTCTGSFNEWRTMYLFDFNKVVQ